MMAHTSELNDAAEQLKRAQRALGETLGQIQDIASAGLDVAHITAALAKSMRNVFSILKHGLDGPDNVATIQASMDSLRETLIMLQDAEKQDAGIQRITSSVARILALLYPVSKIFQKTAGQQPRASASLEGSRDVSRKKTRSPSPARERRSDSRRQIRADIGIHSATNFFTGFTQDISTGGLFVATYDVLRIGTELNVNFRLPKGSVLSLNGTVCWVREYNETNPEMEPGMGVRFERLSAEDRDSINRFMKKKQPMFFDDEG